MDMQIFGYLAAILTTGSFLPQAIKTIKTKDTEVISFWMYLIFCIGVFLWVIYGFYINDIAIFSANIVTFVFAMVILIFKIKNMRKGEKA